MTLSEGHSPAPVHISNAFSVQNSIQVIPGRAAASNTLVHGVPGKMVAGQRHEFTVTPMDAWGNAGATGASIEAFLEPLADGAERIACLVSHGLGGALHVAAESCKSGAYQLCVQLCPEGSKSSVEIIAQKRVVVEDAATDASSCTILSYWPDRGAVAGIAAGFLIQVRFVTNWL